MKLAVIPARGGSKRIPRKNIKSFCGKPMIAWSIEAAKRSKLFDHIVVSTDDDEIAELAKMCDAEAPFLRPNNLADDHTATRPVVNHAIREAAKLWGNFDYICCIYATAPFVNPVDLQNALSQLITTGMDFAFSVTTYAFPIQRALGLDPKGGVAMVQPEHKKTRSQDLKPYFHDAGQFYWGRARAFLNGSDMYSQRAIPIVLPRYRVQDIDTLEDWKRAELLFQALLAQESVNAKA